ALAGRAGADVVADGAHGFDFETVNALARAAAGGESVTPRAADIPDALSTLSYDGYRRIEFRREAALWRGEARGFQAQLFHRGSIFSAPARLWEIADGIAEPIAYDGTRFRLHEPALAGVADGLGADVEHAGFRLLFPLNRPDKHDELIAFLGATYFRALGRGDVYGLSARGLAINTAGPEGEEFPAFTQFWLERPAPDARSARVLALMESRSATGAYAFEIAPGVRSVVDVTAVIHTRRRIARLGIAPLTSMYAFGENDRAGVDDFRPEAHDSDGLQIRTGQGEWIWRPLSNPSRLQISSFFDHSPAGFGLMQRDRAFESYQDPEALYERRPSAWVEPLGDWGPGAVQLVEIPSPYETQDNIVAMWAPEGGAPAGEEIALRYRIHWGADAPVAPDAGRVVATRTGRLLGRRDDASLRKFVVDFDGGLLPHIPADRPLTAEVHVDGGALVFSHVTRLPESAAWRAFFDVRRTRREPVELRCFLKLDDAALTETWSYQWS
ncbi:MAG: glucan biosynthesis protein, partial [Caulobacterales bacterium]|nr:glucan biosynthesis protein [Caulobacterales bacterium]